MQVLNYMALCFVYSIIRSSSSSELARPDGFNFYKDYLRGKQEELPVKSDLDGERVLYFYRTPALLQPSSAAAQEFGKRTTHMFKNYMLSRERGHEGAPAGVGVQKRVSKAALSWLLANKEHYADSGKQLEDIEANLPLHDAVSLF